MTRRDEPEPPVRVRHYARDILTRMEAPLPNNPKLRALERVRRELAEEDRVRSVLRGGYCLPAYLMHGDDLPF